MMNPIRNRSFYSFRAGFVQALSCVLLVAILLAGAAVAAEPTFEQILPAKNTTVLMEYGNLVLRGLDGGGIIMWDRDNPEFSEHWMAGDGINGNHVSDMVWTGQYFWVSMLGGGLTRIKNLDTAPEFRPYSNNLGSLDVTSVTGGIVNGAERVFYGMAGQGVGQINSGISGNIYTAEADGLISNEITSLQMFGDILFVGTPVGVSRFTNNIFSDQNDGLAIPSINDLALDSDGNLLAACVDGVYQWDPSGQTWNLLGNIGAPVVNLASSSGMTYALGREGTGRGVLSEYDGTNWMPITLPYLECTAIAAGEKLWIGGPIDQATDGGHLTYNYLGERLTGNEFDTNVGIATQVTNCEGAAIGADGMVWMGDSFGFHLSGYDVESRSNFFIYERAHAGNDTLNLFPGLGPVLGIAAAQDGNIYAGQYAGGGLLKYDPATGRTDLMDPDNSGLEGRTIVNLVIHPDGPVIVMHDQYNTQRVEVLVEPDNWQGTSGWVIPPMDQGLDAGFDVWDAVVERSDIIWFAVQDGGLVRWDINGPNAGPNDPLTWFDQSDDLWYDPVTNFPKSSLDPRKAKGLALGKDGSLWAGGNGLVQFTYELTGGTSLEVTVVQDFPEKSPAVPNGLVNGNVEDIAVDRNGDIWVATATGLNRVHPKGAEAEIAAWIDLVNYLENSDYGLLYSPNVIAPLPGRAYARIVASLDGRQMVLSADQGTTLITVGSGPGSAGNTEDPLKSAFCYPNPWTPGVTGGQLKVGGLPDGTMEVAIYNLEGQLVFADNAVALDAGFWEGENFKGNPAASGMYVVKISYNGSVTTRVLAIAR